MTVAKGLPARFDDKRIIFQLLDDAVNDGVDLRELDVLLSRVAPVDLDLLHGCISQYLRCHLAALKAA